MFTIRSLDTKKIEEKLFFNNESDGREITLIIGWRSGEVYTDEDPELDDHDEIEGSCVACDQGEDLEDNWVTIVDGDIDDEEKEEIIAAWQDNMEDGLADLGWSWLDREVWFYGPIEITED